MITNEDVAARLDAALAVQFALVRHMLEDRLIAPEVLNALLSEAAGSHDAPVRTEIERIANGWRRTADAIGLPELGG